MAKRQRFGVSLLLDSAEELRRAGRIELAAETVGRCLRLNPRHLRARLLMGRLLYQEGKIPEALEELRSLDSLLPGDEQLRALTRSLEQIHQAKDSRKDSFFVTESMARLLSQQGYHLEALTVYRRLFLDSGGQSRFWDAILLLRDRLGQEGSRGATKEQVAEELRDLKSWIEAQPKGF